MGGNYQFITPEARIERLESVKHCVGLITCVRCQLTGYSLPVGKGEDWAIRLQALPSSESATPGTPVPYGCLPRAWNPPEEQQMHQSNRLDDLCKRRWFGSTMGHLPYSLSLSSSHGWPAPLLWQRDKWHWQTPCQLKFWWSQILVVTKYRRHKTFWLLAWRLVHFDDYLGKKSWCRQLLNVYCIYTPLQKYWNSEANSFIFAVYWKNLGLTSKDEYETRDQHFSFYFQVFISGSDKQLRR